MLHKGKVNCVTLMELWVGSLEFILDVTWSHLVEAKVLDDVPEEHIRYDAFILLVVEIEAFLEVIKHVGWQMILALGRVSYFGYVYLSLHFDQGKF